MEALSESLRAELSPRDFGFFTQAVRDRMQRSSAPINDFGQLFLGFNLFLILSALFLMSVFAGLAIDRRRSQQGLMVAVGYTSAAVGRSVLAEFGVVTLVGCVAGVVAAVGLAQGFIAGLMGVWSDAVGVMELPMWISGSTLLMGAAATWTVSVAAAWIGTRSAVSTSAWSNLHGESVTRKMNAGLGWPIRWGGWTALAIALAVALLSSAARGPSAAMVYFGCGALVLVGCLLHVWSWLCRPSVGVPASLAAVGVASLRVRPKSSLAVVSVLAVGLFMVGGIGGGTLQSRVDPENRHAGTGGFSWLVETRVPVQADLSGEPGLRAHGLEAHVEPGQVVGIGLFAGDDASCMNLGSAQTPRLLGVHPSALMERDSFRFLEPSGGNWQMLRGEAGREGVIPVIGDAATVYWGLHLGVGDEISAVDEQGEALRLRIAGVVENWIFQGALVADRDQLVERFPSRRGDSLFLIDQPSDPDALAARITDRLGDYGVVVERPVAVLEGYRRVERTFMLIFGALGGLGVILAVVGIVALFYRRMVDAERERALLVALGFVPRHARMLGLAEMGGLMLMGLACGVLATAVAMVPSLQLMDGSAFFRFLSLALSVLLVGILGVVLVSSLTDRRGSVEAIHRNQ